MSHRQLGEARMAVAASHRRQSADSGSVFGSKCDDNVGWFGFVRLQTIRIGVAPVGNVHHRTCLLVPVPRTNAARHFSLPGGIGLFDLTEIVSVPTRRGSLTMGQDLPRRRRGGAERPPYPDQ